MVESVDHRQMPDADVIDISAYLASLELPSKLPPVDETAPDFNAYERLLAAKQIVQIPRAEGDTAAGERLYKRECGSCHGPEGWGNERDSVPMLAGQYTNYLWRQVDKYITRERIHDPSDPEDDLLAQFTQEELRDIFAYLSIVDD
jgi:cytochrome c553